ncbi:hypothetical protein BCR33DRAFT_236118 [Rhizoclosmatium globosum]|uniref:Uncharacterized protein n=1 Tax=Rhizoclosmatium globosum TaxID=329046 RepID=A0A1Y2CAS8_9FUNG|nr:hypothetical protein BCR33DRAFT_236118 [Rhizoclosmatium globosum]|eukprot:ORY44140.1 hypothetical protein BCR33DRAFT_236118 [Rhizoclosmatium globosum]
MQNGTISSIDTATFYLHIGLSVITLVELIFFVVFVAIMSIQKARSNDSTRPSISAAKIIFSKFNVFLVIMLLVVTFQPAVLASALIFSHDFHHAPKWHVILNIFGNATIETAYILYCWIRCKGIPGLKNRHSIRFCLSS